MRIGHGAQLGQERRGVAPGGQRESELKDIAREEPLLDRTNLKGAPLYYDCSTDDARLTLENALDAATSGAVITPWAKVVEFTRAPDGGRADGVIIEDAFTGERKTVRANAIINATGPWTDALMRVSAGGNADLPQLLRPTKGVHIVVARERLPVEHAVVCFHPEDGRVLFAIPWGDRTYLGTTDTDYVGDPAKVAAVGDDIRFGLRRTGNAQNRRGGVITRDPSQLPAHQSCHCSQ